MPLLTQIQVFFMFNKLKQTLLGRHEETGGADERDAAAVENAHDLRQLRRAEELDESPSVPLPPLASLENSTTLGRSPESILDQIDKEWGMQQVAFARAKVERDLLIDANSRIDFEHELQLKVRTRLLAEKQADKLAKQRLEAEEAARGARIGASTAIPQRD